MQFFNVKSLLSTALVYLLLQSAAANPVESRQDAIPCNDAIGEVSPDGFKCCAPHVIGVGGRQHPKGRGDFQLSGPISKLSAGPDGYKCCAVRIVGANGRCINETATCIR
ncbi:hypothetical protein C8J56DRAFT_1161691 [Mycena floridula]|nr:hypothetical protein C8J56DRAFT_1161691 [Mycena floridula]